MGAKPHFRYKARVWSCASREYECWLIGYGYTILDAWRDWQKQHPLFRGRA